MVQKETEDAIYIYNISEEDLPFVREKFFKNETKPIVVRNYEKKEEQRWTEDYDVILQELIEKNGQENMDRLTSKFNMRVYEFDQNTRRRPRRFSC